MGKKTQRFLTAYRLLLIRHISYLKNNNNPFLCLLLKDWSRNCSHPTSLSCFDCGWFLNWPFKEKKRKCYFIYTVYIIDVVHQWYTTSINVFFHFPCPEVINLPISRSGLLIKPLHNIGKWKENLFLLWITCPGTDPNQGDSTHTRNEKTPWQGPVRCG